MPDLYMDAHLLNPNVVGAPMSATNKRHELNWGQVEFGCKQIVRDKNQCIGFNRKHITHPVHPIIGIIAISRGGSIPAVILSHLMNTPVTHTIRVSSFEHHNLVEHTRGGTQIIGAPALTRDEIEHSLFVDDIIDTGGTIDTLHNFYHGGTFVTLAGKPRGLNKYNKHLLVDPPFIVSDDTWVVFPWETRKI